MNQQSFEVGSHRFVVEGKQKGTVSKLLLSMCASADLSHASSEALWQTTLFECDSLTAETLDPKMVRSIQLIGGNQLYVELKTEDGLEKIWLWLETGKSMTPQWNE